LDGKTRARPNKSADKSTVRVVAVVRLPPEIRREFIGIGNFRVAVFPAFVGSFFAATVIRRRRGTHPTKITDNR